MDWNELRNDWQARSDRAALELDLRPAARERLWQRVRARDGLETLIAVLMLPFFGFAALRLVQAGMWVPALFAVGLLAAIAYVPWRLWRVRQSIPEPDPAEPVLDFLRAERNALLGQADMLRSVARWYSGPICLGAAGFFVSLNGPTLGALLYALLVAAVFAGIEIGNRAAVRKSFEPAIEAVDHQISQLEQES
ncbi:hypothetical protein HFP89_10370 [Wenzhouxiangella sp. XN79A]|uniref:hypothetical protein n=1 Tax=Wenzhouxiangella sp. XN79A TaxID=2724193 RepID=UPI00144A5025|nr:hypothetical protein [Wenzhouxiangella sp. XN79A]NKI35569.1 hypothetical protein [Wenzhouxiangella sp. XN79A]